MELKEVVSAAPMPVLLGLVVFIAHVLLIADTGAGAPIFFPIVKRLGLKPFKPSKVYERIKSKYVA